MLHGPEAKTQASHSRHQVARYTDEKMGLNDTCFML